MERALPDSLKLSIAKKIENNLFSKVIGFNNRFILNPIKFKGLNLQVTFLSGLKAVGEIRALFAAEVFSQYFVDMSKQSDHDSACVTVASQE